MNRTEIVNTLGLEYMTTNVENDEWSYIQDAGSKKRLAEVLGKTEKELHHVFLDRRFKLTNDQGTLVILVETKQDFKDSDKTQLKEYLEAENALHKGENIVCILANTKDDKIKVWVRTIEESGYCPEETVLQNIEYYQRKFFIKRQNDKRTVMQNTYALNTLLHKMDIDEDKRSQFVGTCILFIKDQIKTIACNDVDELKTHWSVLKKTQITGGIKDTLDDLLDGTVNKDIKVKLLQKNILEDQKVKALTTDEWVDILVYIKTKILDFIDENSSEGQDILNLFFITFNKYTGKADKNQAFTPDHITEFMARITGINKDTRVLDPCCGSGSFLIQAMTKALSDCNDKKNAEELKSIVRKEHIYGIECEEKAFGLSTTNMLIHGDGNSNIVFGSCFDMEEWISKAHPSVILMNPPYNAKPKSIPDEYKAGWAKSEKDGKEDPTKGLVFVQYLSDIAKKYGWVGTKLAVLLPMSAAIGTSSRIAREKSKLLKNNTLEAVFSLPAEIFYPGASAQACCMVFTLNQSHFDSDGTPNKQTFFGYYKDDGFKKKKTLGRVEQFDAKGQSKWKTIEKDWLDLYKNKTVKAGMSAMQAVNGNDEWLCEAYMKTDYSKLTDADFQQTVNDYLAYLVKNGKVTA